MDSEKFKALLKDFRYTIPAGIIIGLILGLVIGWGIWPVQWTDAAAEHLRPDLREDYLRMAIFSAANTNNVPLANSTWTELGDVAGETLETVKANPEFLTQDQIDQFATVVGAETAPEEAPIVEETVVAEEPQPTKEEEMTGQDEDGPNWLLLGGLCAGLILVAGVMFYLLVLRGSLAKRDDVEPLDIDGSAKTDVGFDEDANRYAATIAPEYEKPVKQEPSVPVAQFMTTYMVGDDLYDDSFSVDAPTGEFLGECGVGISETVGVGEPKHVTAFEVWLFDKNDIQTVTKVVMSAHAYDDDKIRMRLESKGEPILAEPGKQVLLETASLQLEARIIDMEYGEGAAPDQSFFQRLTLELAVWPK